MEVLLRPCLALARPPFPFVEVEMAIERSGEVVKAG